MSDFYKINIKDSVEIKTKSEEKKKELPPLPNLKIEYNSKKSYVGTEDNENKMNEQKGKLDRGKNKSFKMDKSFLKDD